MGNQMVDNLLTCVHSSFYNSIPIHISNLLNLPLCIVGVREKVKRFFVIVVCDEKSQLLAGATGLTQFSTVSDIRGEPHQAPRGRVCTFVEIPTFDVSEEARRETIKKKVVYFA